jgi:hypothetical protein
MGVGKSTFAFTSSSISINDGSTTIDITRDNQSYSHKLSHGYGDLATLAVGTTSYKWTPTADTLASFLKEIPNQKSRLIDVYLDTYNGSTRVGRDVHALTVTLSEATGKPSLSDFAINDTNATAKDWDVIVIGKSVLSASQTATAKYGASIVKTVYTYGSNEYSSITDLIASLPLTTTPKSYTIGCKTTDSRGFVTTASLSKSCAKYEAPTIDSVEFVRCDADGNETEAGTKVKAIVKGSWASIGGKNTATLKIGYKLQNGTSYTEEAVTVTNGTVNVEQVLSATLDASSDYLFSVSLADGMSVTFSEDSIGFSNSKNIMYVSADGEELILGSSSEGNVLIGSEKVQIRKGEKVRASFESDKLTLGDGYLALGYDDTASGIGSYLSSSEYDAINLIIPAETGSLPSGDNIASRLHMWGGPRPAIELSNSEGADLLVGVIQDDATSEYGSLIRLTGEYIKLQATKTLTYNIPTLQAGNCNTLTESGKYYLGNNSTNRPENTNGWLECMKYSTDYCAQTYTTYNGKKYTRYQQNGTWGAWFRVWQSRQLFGNESQAMNTTITLSDSAANYDMLEIFYKTNDGQQNSTKVYSPNNKTTSLTSATFFGDNKIVIKSKTVKISGKTIDTYKDDNNGYYTGEVGFTGNTNNGAYRRDNVGIIRVLGWR